MFLKFVDRIGLLDVVAPKKRGKRQRRNDQGGSVTPEEKGKGEAEVRAPQEEDPQVRLYNAQSEKGFFVEKQRVRYFHKGTETWHNNAVIVGVHFDDGPDKPYYVRELCESVPFF